MKFNGTQWIDKLPAITDYIEIRYIFKNNIAMQRTNSQY